MFLITSIAMLRERTTGTLERLLTTRWARSILFFAYGIAFGIAAAVQASIGTGVAYRLFDLDTAGNAGLVISSRSPTPPSSGSRWACSAARSPGPSSRRCSSCRWWSYRSSSSVDCS